MLPVVIQTLDTPLEGDNSCIFYISAPLGGFDLLTEVYEELVYAHDSIHHSKHAAAVLPVVIQTLDTPQEGDNSFIFCISAPLEGFDLVTEVYEELVYSHDSIHHSKHAAAVLPVVIQILDTPLEGDNSCIFYISAPLGGFDLLTEVYEELVYSHDSIHHSKHAAAVLPVVIQTLDTPLEGDNSCIQKKCARMVKAVKLLLGKLMCYQV